MMTGLPNPGVLGLTNFQTIGPYPVRISLPHDPENIKFMIKDLAGKTHSFTYTVLESTFLSHLKIAENPKQANSFMVYDGKEITGYCLNPIDQCRFILWTVDNLSTSPISESFKKFICSKCNASFSNGDTLKIHKQYYCNDLIFPRSQTCSPSIGNNLQMTSLSSSKTLFPPPQLPLHQQHNSLQVSPQIRDIAKNCIFLPIATHNNSHGIQMLGQPQIIIPIAINKDFNLNTNSTIYVKSEMCLGIDIQKKLNFGNDGFCINVETEKSVNLPTSTSNLSQNSIELTRKRTTSVDGNKIDLTTNNQSLDFQCKKMFLESLPSQMSNILPSTTSVCINQILPEKKFQCCCSASFSTEETFAAHVKTYCKNRAIKPDETITKELQRKTLRPCPKCNCYTSSTAEMTQHLKNIHDYSKSFICKICSYKGFSERGMKAHLKIHEEISIQDEDFQKYITVIHNEGSETKIQ
uniref:C2H2-type domain-containing protein n=1 Tax=Strongyloides venezuelensis TaxID=75913 RepID=A0A0K0F7F2_STRVS